MRAIRIGAFADEVRLVSLEVLRCPGDRFVDLAEDGFRPRSGDFVHSSATPPVAPPASIAISFGKQVRVTIEGAPDATTLANVIGALTAGGRGR